MIENNHEKENRKLYRQTFDEIHASEELLERTETMKGKKTITKLARFGYAFAAAAAIFVASNGITYAAAGESWTEKIIVYINGSAYESNAESAVDEYGNPYVNVDLGEYGKIGIGEDYYRDAEISVEGTSTEDYSITIITDNSEIEDTVIEITVEQDTEEADSTE